MTNPPVDWLLSGEPWTTYRTRLDLLGESDSAAQAAAARAAMLAHPLVAGLIAGLADWPGEVIASHKSAGQPFHRLTFLADLGVKAEDAGVADIAAQILAHASEEGPFQLPADYPQHFGGPGGVVWAWALCDAPLLVYALVKFGLGEHPAVQTAVQHLVGLVRQNGWPCAVSKELGGFRGPGKKEDPCPFADLIMLKLLAELPGMHDGSAARAGVEALLALWQDSLTRHPYIFYMGTDFRKLKAPFVWYDLLHVLDVLSRFHWLRQDARLRDMLGVLQNKMDAQGRFTSESVWQAWKAWDFGQKKEPSRWLTLCAWRIMNRIDCGAG